MSELKTKSIVDYQLCSAMYASKLQEQVQKAIKEGWVPFGSIAVIPAVMSYHGTVYSGGSYTQPMVKYG